ncbi:MAG: hypothetical protein ACM3U2_14550, partial [Deltaproteobacteria bacterium]
RPAIPVVHSRLQPAVANLSRQIAQFARKCQFALIQHREDVVNQQYVLERLGDAAMELFMSSCVYSRMMSILAHPNHDAVHTNRDLQSGILYMGSAHRRNARRLAELRDNDDAEQTRTADAFLKGEMQH